MNDTALPGMRASTVNLPLYCMANRPSSTAPRWQAAGGAAVGLTSARPIDIINIHDVYGSAVYQAFCTNARFLLPAQKAQDVYVLRLQHSDWLRLRVMDQSQEILLGHSGLCSSQSSMTQLQSYCTIN